MEGQFNLNQQVWWIEELVQNCPTCSKGRLADTVSNIGTGVVRNMQLSQAMTATSIKTCPCTEHCFCIRHEDWDNPIPGTIEATYGIKRTDPVGDFNVNLKEQVLFNSLAAAEAALVSSKE